MRRLAAFLRRDWLVASSYRTRMILSAGSLLTLVIPTYFIAQAVQPVVGDAIRSEGGQYFAFVVLGMATFQFASIAVSAIPTAIASGIRTGTWEALLATPTRLPVLLLGMSGYSFLWAVVRSVLLLVSAWILGAEFELHRMVLALLIWAVVTLSYLPFGLLSASLLLVTRTSGVLPNAVLTGSIFLGGVYYPTHVIPSWLQTLSQAVPLTYGLRALRRTLSPEFPMGAIAGDLGVLVLLTAVLFGIGVVAFRAALAYARRNGTLAQY